MWSRLYNSKTTKGTKLPTIYTKTKSRRNRNKQNPLRRSIKTKLPPRLPTRRNIYKRPTRTPNNKDFCNRHRNPYTKKRPRPSKAPRPLQNSRRFQPTRPLFYRPRNPTRQRTRDSTQPYTRKTKRYKRRLLRCRPTNKQSRPPTTRPKGPYNDLPHRAKYKCPTTRSKQFPL